MRTTRERMPGDLVDEVIVLDEALLADADDSFETVDTSADDPAQIYYTSGTTGLAKGILHAHRYILGHEEFLYCHDVQDGELFHGMGEWAWAAGICPLIGPWRYGATQFVYAREGGFDPHRQLEVLSRHGVSNVFTTPTAMRSMMAIEDAGERYPQRFRIVCSAGEPLNPEAIRWFRDQYGVTVLDYYGLSESYPLCGNFPFMEVREGSMGRPMPGWDVQILDEDENPVGVGERGEICLRARSNPHYPLGYWRNEEAARETFGGDWFHTRDAAERDEDGYFWYAGRADDVIISAGYRIGPFEVESACIEHPAVREAAAVASPDERRGNVVKAFIVLAEGTRAVGRAGRGDQGLRPRQPLRLRLPEADRVHRRAAEDADREDPADRASRGGAGASRGRRTRRPPQLTLAKAAARAAGGEANRRSRQRPSGRLQHLQHRVGEAVLFAELGDGLGLEVVPVVGAERRQLLGVELARQQLRHLLEEVLEAARRDDLEDPARGVVGVPESVPLAARLERQVAGLGIDDVVAQQCAHAALEDEAVLVLALVDVHRRDQGLRRDRVLDEREQAAGLLRPGHEADADRAEIDRLAVVRPHDARPLARVEADSSFALGGLHHSSLNLFEHHCSANLTHFRSVCQD